MKLLTKNGCFSFVEDSSYFNIYKILEPDFMSRVDTLEEVDIDVQEVTNIFAKALAEYLDRSQDDEEV